MIYILLMRPFSNFQFSFLFELIFDTYHFRKCKVHSCKSVKVHFQFGCFNGKLYERFKHQSKSSWHLALVITLFTNTAETFFSTVLLIIFIAEYEDLCISTLLTLLNVSEFADRCCLFVHRAGWCPDSLS